MEELKTVLMAHGARYPKLQIQDAVKLIYQNEFGGGHLIRDRERFFSMLYREYDSLTFDEGKPLTESIGNGLVRVNLCRLRREQLEPLGERFIAFSVRHQGSLPRFLEKLEVLRALTEEGVFAFGTEELEEYLEAYAKAGYPMVSHSEVYRQCYAPAYRILPEDLWKA